MFETPAGFGLFKVLDEEKLSKIEFLLPKYGLIYHASLVSQAAPKHKGKISCSLAAKSALAFRCDALGEGEDNTMGLKNRLKLEARLRSLEGKELRQSAGSVKGKPKIEFYDQDKKKGSGGMITPAKTYNPAADSILALTKALSKDDEDKAEEPEVVEGEQKKKKKKKRTETEDDGAVVEAEPVKKEKKKRKHAEEAKEEGDTDKKKKKKKRKHAETEDGGDDTSAKKKEKKKKKKKKSDD